MSISLQSLQPSTCRSLPSPSLEGPSQQAPICSTLQRQYPQYGIYSTQSPRIKPTATKASTDNNMTRPSSQKETMSRAPAQGNRKDMNRYRCSLSRTNRLSHISNNRRTSKPKSQDHFFSFFRSFVSLTSSIAQLELRPFVAFDNPNTPRTSSTTAIAGSCGETR